MAYIIWKRLPLPRISRNFLKPSFFLAIVILILLFTGYRLMTAPTSTPKGTSEDFASGFEGDQDNKTHGHRAKDSSKLSYKKTAYDLFLEKPIINKHEFPYIINQPRACYGRAIHLVITTPSAPGNFFRRMMTRSRQALSRQMLHYFFIGATRNTAVQKKIKAESIKFNDIIQEDYIDVYVNITYKAVQMLRWVSELCPNARYVLRMDDDISGNLAKQLGAMTKAYRQYDNFVMGDVKFGWLPCSSSKKCNTTKEEYPHATLPPFALGGALGYPTSSVKRLFEATKRVKRFKLDDVYVTGMCAPLVNVTLLHDPEFTFRHLSWS